ncbi:hypothetical protein ABZW18_00255 [Streptomyces sp. NPDC004647]|uniref:hypothetical protein n=1 Tax=Streptomyces sp. NPDC004647 TaxID=3154671 RepID=UPI0033A96448
MTTPTAPVPTSAVLPAPFLPPNPSADATEAELVRLARLGLRHGPRRSRALDLEGPPPAGPRDLLGLETAMAGVHADAAQDYYLPHPSWVAIQQIHAQADSVLQQLNVRAERMPQLAVQAAHITVLASSLIERHAAEISTYLETHQQHATPGAAAMGMLKQAAERNAARAAGIDPGTALNTPKTLGAHLRKLSKAIQQLPPLPSPPQNTSGRIDQDEALLDTALTIGAQGDPDLAEASHVMSALSNLGQAAAQSRLVLDVRLHGTVETAQLRGFEMISSLARKAVARYDNQGRGDDGRRAIAALVHHLAEQRLERMRGTLAENERRSHGYYYDNGPRDPHLDTLFEESRTLGDALRAKFLTPQDRTDLQISFLLTQNAIGKRIGMGYPMDANFPPKQWVAGMETDTPVETRIALIDALRHRVEKAKRHPDAPFLKQAANRFALEIAGPAELSRDALDAEITAQNVIDVAQHLVHSDALASPLALASTPELGLTHPQAERALHVLHTLNVVGPREGIQPRATTATAPDLPTRLNDLEQRLPELLQAQRPPATPDQGRSLPGSAAREPEATPRPPESAAPERPERPAPRGPRPALPRRRRGDDRPGPANIARPPQAPAGRGSESDVAQLLEARAPEIAGRSQTIIEDGRRRTPASPAPAATHVKPVSPADEAQRQSQPQPPAAGVAR